MVKFIFLKNIFLRSTILDDHPAQRNDCCVDFIGPVKQKHMIAAEVINLSVELTRKVACLEGLKWAICVGHIKLIQSACIHLGMGDKSTLEKVFITFYLFTLAGNSKYF